MEKPEIIFRAESEMLSSAQVALTNLPRQMRNDHRTAAAEWACILTALRHPTGEKA